MSLPLIKDSNSNLMLLETQWKSQLDPLIANTITQGVQLTNIQLANGATIINHLLGRQMIGWFITDINAAATVYRSQPLNNKTLTLTSSATATVSLWCY